MEGKLIQCSPIIRKKSDPCQTQGETYPVQSLSLLTIFQVPKQSHSIKYNYIKNNNFRMILSGAKWPTK